MAQALSSQAEKLASEIEKLTPEDQLILADQILARMPDDQVTDDELLELILKREELHRVNPQPMSSWEEIVAGIEKIS